MTYVPDSHTIAQMHQDVILSQNRSGVTEGHPGVPSILEDWCWSKHLSQRGENASLLIQPGFSHRLIIHLWQHLIPNRPKGITALFKVNMELTFNKQGWFMLHKDVCPRHKHSLYQLPAPQLSKVINQHHETCFMWQWRSLTSLSGWLGMQTRFGWRSLHRLFVCLFLC